MLASVLPERYANKFASWNICDCPSKASAHQPSSCRCGRTGSQSGGDARDTLSLTRLWPDIDWMDAVMRGQHNVLLCYTNIPAKKPGTRPGQANGLLRVLGSSTTVPAANYSETHNVLPAQGTYAANRAIADFDSKPFVRRAAGPRNLAGTPFASTPSPGHGKRRGTPIGSAD
jgi:hypothetical protein